jgi:alpha-galactosidase
MPMYSTWYAYHQKLEHKELIEELRLAKQYGMESVIIDDGWQTDDGKRGYAYCGDWKPVKLADMKQFVSDVHEVGMKCIVWFGVPFVGIHSEAWGNFQGKFLNGFDEKHPWCVLDPRYPDVREYLISIYKNAVSEWNIDGLKLDFINNMHLTEYSSLPNENMDFESLEDAICELLSEIKKVLSDINPEIMIEFRQPYIGPIMRKYGNMLRVADCPMDALKNRAGIVDLKMTSGNTAVHSDMLMWNYDDTPESAALQIINIMFGVPQISVLIENLSEEHKNVLKFYLSLWNKNRECLVNGKLSAYNPETGYSFISSETETTLIAASYVKNILKIEKAYKKVIFVNGSWDEKLLVDNNLSDFNAEYNIYNCMGEIVNSGTISIINGINCFEVPNSGMLELHIK